MKNTKMTRIREKDIREFMAVEGKTSGEKIATLLNAYRAYKAIKVAILRGADKKDLIRLLDIKTKGGEING